MVNAGATRLGTPLGAPALIGIALLFALATLRSAPGATPGGLRSTRIGKTGPPAQSHLASDISRTVATLPGYSVFDWIDANLRGNGVVRLTGFVVTPALKGDAQARVAALAGVSSVTNDIQVLPNTEADKVLRAALQHSIFALDDPPAAYAVAPVPPIHIIVRDGHVTLYGAVASKQEWDLVDRRCHLVPILYPLENLVKVEPAKTG